MRDIWTETIPGCGAGRFPLGVGRVTSKHTGEWRTTCGLWFRFRDSYLGVCWR